MSPPFPVLDFTAGRSTVTNALAHTGCKVVVKMDVKDFFPTVTLRRVKGVFRKAGYREQVATLLALLCTESPREVVERFVEAEPYVVQGLVTGWTIRPCTVVIGAAPGS